MKQHYHTIFGDVPDGDIDFGFAFDGTLMMGLQVPDGMDWCQYGFSVLDILVNIPLDQVDKWCLETCIAELS